jgi:hypothetical protein
MAARDGIAGAAERQVKVTAKEFAVVAQSKTEVYRFLASECDCFLDQPQSHTIFHLKDIVSGKRRMLKSTEVKHLFVPQFDSLSTAKMLNWAKAHPEVFQALPRVQAEIEMLHRQYVVNVIYTIVGESFADWVQE